MIVTLNLLINCFFIHYLNQEPLDTSVSSTTSKDGAGSAHYTYDPADLTNLTDQQEIEEKISAKLDGIITTQMAKYCIGKTYISRQNDRSTWNNFNPLDTETWEKKGIRSCSSSHKKEYPGGLVVVCAITRKNVPANLGKFVIEMKDSLQQRYKGDKRFVNTRKNAGQRADQYYAYAIYIAYAEEKENPGKEKEENDEEEESEDTEVED